jgi:hypothetical protein
MLRRFAVLREKLICWFSKNPRTQQEVWNDNCYIKAVIKHQGFLWNCIANRDIDSPAEKKHTIEQAFWLNAIIKEASNATLVDKHNYHGSLIRIVELCIKAHYGYEAAPDAPFMEVFKTEYDWRMNNYTSERQPN